MIRKATSSDIENILLLTNACAKNMTSKGIYQWNEHYPNAEAFHNDIKRDELYVLAHDHKIVGVIVISTFMDDVYKPITWLTPSGKNIYIHRLAVDPEYQGRGFAQRLMDFAEKYALDNMYNSVRLDTFSQNERNQRFYERRGYKRLGSIYFPNKSEHPFYCYEMVL
ncbi:GNAT family N-acetyltransferase [Gelidibacter sp.]|uniref:GNAT family N-acetyltransferase n=1 Tax=Gelidibacter sp. TaxID=2018083 RepID=UPI0032647B2B